MAARAEASSESESDSAADASSDGTPDDGSPPVDGAREGSEASTAYACARGACNTPTHACLASGRCYCSADRDCKSGKCVRVAGQNDQSCGTACTGSGNADGFSCQISSCSSDRFKYTPSNFNPGAYAPPSSPTTDCNATYSSSSHTFTAGS